MARSSIFKWTALALLLPLWSAHAESSATLFCAEKFHQLYDGIRFSFRSDVRGRLIENPSPGIPAPATIDESEVRRLLQAALPEDEEALKFLVKEIRASRISFSDFRHNLNESAKRFVDQNPALIRERKFVNFSYVRGDAKKKSNEWTLELLVKDSSANGLPKEIEAFNNAKDLALRMHKDGIRDILITDDASFSGEQLHLILTQVAKELKGRKAKVHLVIPYMTLNAERRIAQWKGNLDIQPYSVARIPGFAETIETAVRNESLSPSAAKRLKSLLRFNIDTDADGDSHASKALHYFDHKLPDFLSSVVSRDRQSGTVLTDLRIPSRNGIEDFHLVRAGPSPY